MPLGPAVRSRLGRLEQPAAEAYRRMFIDLDQFADALADACSPAARILEIGCGDGSVADRVAARFPDADYVGIDVCPEPGRRYRGDPRRATFEAITSRELRARDPEPFDLVVLVDVLHHIPDEADRAAVLADAHAMCSPTGTVVIKDWDRDLSVGHALTYAADRYLSGDRAVRFSRIERFLELGGQAMPGRHVAWSGSVRPWKNNFALGWRL